MEIKDIVKHGVEHSSTPVSKAPQGSKKHKTDVLQYIEKMKDMYEPTYPTQASPEMMGKAAERIERARQMTGEKKQLSTWDLLK